jgi:hypothetical protein
MADEENQVTIESAVTLLMNDVRQFFRQHPDIVPIQDSYYRTNLLGNANLTDMVSGCCGLSAAYLHRQGSASLIDQRGVNVRNFIQQRYLLPAAFVNGFCDGWDNRFEDDDEMTSRVALEKYGNRVGADLFTEIVKS